MTDSVCQVHAKCAVIRRHVTSDSVQCCLAAIPLLVAVCARSGVGVVGCQAAETRVRAQYRPFARCQDNNGKSCKRARAAIPDRSELSEWAGSQSTRPPPLRSSDALPLESVGAEQVRYA